jgi:hypothetical protein
MRSNDIDHEDDGQGVHDVGLFLLSALFLPFIGDLTQSRGTECVWFGCNESPVVAVLYVNALDRSVREGYIRAPL